MNRCLRPLRTDGGEDDDETPLQQLVAGVVIACIFLVGFGLLAVGYPWFWVAFPVGFAGVLPAALALAKLYEQRGETDDTAAVDADVTDERADALAVLRDRYARGELDEEEFEHRLERLLETERVADAKAHIEREKERVEER